MRSRKGGDGKEESDLDSPKNPKILTSPPTATTLLRGAGSEQTRRKRGRVTVGLAPNSGVSLYSEAQGDLTHLKKGLVPASLQCRNSCPLQEVHTLLLLRCRR